MKILVHLRFTEIVKAVLEIENIEIYLSLFKTYFSLSLTPKPIAVEKAD